MAYNYPKNKNFKLKFGEMSDNINKLEQELCYLQKLLKDRDMHIDVLKRRLEEKEAEIDVISSELRGKLQRLEGSYKNDKMAFESTIHEKDELIMLLKGKLDFPRDHPPPPHLDEFVCTLQKRIVAQNEIITDLEGELSSIKCHPIQREIHYEKDPFLISQNSNLSAELERSLKEEQRAKILLKERTAEVARLNLIIVELKARPPQTIIKDRVVEIPIESVPNLADPLDHLLLIYERSTADFKKRAIFAIVYYHKQMQYYRRLALEKREKVVVTQKLEVVDGTLEIYRTLQVGFVDWLFEVFVRSTDRAHDRKMYTSVLI